MNAQVEFCMLNREETCFNETQNHFHEFGCKIQVKSKVGWFESLNV